MSEKEKKRKRHTDSTDRPRKKIANEAEQPVKVKHLGRRSNDSPILISTPGTKVPPSLSFQTYVKPLSDTSSKNAATAPSELLLHSSEHPRIDYTGREDGSSSNGVRLKHYIGVFNPAVNELQVLEVRSMVIRGALRKEKNEAEQEKLTNREKVNTLSKTFGTKKAKKIADSYTLNAISPADRQIVAAEDGTPIKLDAAAAALLESMGPAQESSKDNKALLAAIADAKPRPKPNLAATKPSEVYTIEQLIGKEMLKQLSIMDWIEAAKTKTDIKSKSRHVSRRFADLALKADAGGDRAQTNILKLKALKYLNLLINFSQSLKTVGHAKKIPRDDDLAQAMGISVTMALFIKQQFAGSGPSVNKWHMDYLRSHVAALALVIGDCRTPTLDIQEDLGIEKKEITQYFLELGCRVKSLSAGEKRALNLTNAMESRQYLMASLNLPLEFPKPRTAAKRGRAK